MHELGCELVCCQCDLSSDQTLPVFVFSKIFYRTDRTSAVAFMAYFNTTVNLLLHYFILFYLYGRAVKVQILQAEQTPESKLLDRLFSES